MPGVGKKRTRKFKMSENVTPMLPVCGMKKEILVLHTKVGVLPGF